MDTYTKRERTIYLLGMLGQNLIYGVIGTGLTYYFQSVIFLPALAISTITLLSKIAEFLCDPYVGMRIDRSQNTKGKCRTYLIFSPLPIFIFSLLCFLNRPYTAAETSTARLGILLAAGLSFIGFGICFCFGDVALWTLPNLMTKSRKDRNALLAQARIVAGICGAGISLLLLPLSQAAGNHFSKQRNDPTLGLQMGTVLVCGSILLLGMLLFQPVGFCTRERVTAPPAEKRSLWRNLTEMWRMQIYRRILLSGLLRTPSGLMNLLQMTVLSYYFGNNGRTPYVHYMLLLGIPAFLGQLIAAGAAPKLADKHGAATTFAQANVFAGLALLAAFALFLCRPQQLTQALPFTLLILLLFCNMFCCGLVNTVQSILIADAADLTEKESGIRRDGIFVSGQSLLIKLSTGVSALLQGLVFAISGFSGTAVRQINLRYMPVPTSQRIRHLQRRASLCSFYFCACRGSPICCLRCRTGKAEIHIRHLYKRPLYVVHIKIYTKKRNPMGCASLFCSCALLCTRWLIVRNNKHPAFVF